MENEFINLEQPNSPDQSQETKPEAKTEVKTEKVAETKSSKTASSKQAITKPVPIVKQVPVIKDPQIKQIEDVLAAGLEDYYKKLNPSDQKKFKESGEQAASEVNTLLQKAVVKIEEVISIIKKWLGTVPGLNIFFVEQSAKIKADKIFLNRKVR